jgi:hypothetical protein
LGEIPQKNAGDYAGEIKFQEKGPSIWDFGLRNADFSDVGCLYILDYWMGFPVYVSVDPIKIMIDKMIK